MSHAHHGANNNFLELATAALRGSGGRMTQTRLAVIECLSKAPKPLSAQEIFEKLNHVNHKGKIDRVSVYRILEALGSKGLVHAVGSTGKFLACFHSQCHAGQHLILSCSICHLAREVDLPAALSKSLQNYLSKQQKFNTQGHGLFLEGCCQSCADKLNR